MRISQLASAADVPVATVKFYLRDGLLHDGLRTSATQAEYDDSHLRRLQLIRSLTGPAGLSLAQTRRVLDVLDDPPPTPLDLLRAAHSTVSPPVSTDPGDLARARSLLDRWGWGVHCHHDSAVDALARALQGLADADFDPGDETLDRYARSMLDLAEREIAALPVDSTTDITRYVVLGTVLVEPLLLALRRLAQGYVSENRFAAGTKED